MNKTHKENDIFMGIANQVKTISTIHEIRTPINGVRKHDIDQ